jgi:hypothetical protein
MVPDFSDQLTEAEVAEPGFNGGDSQPAVAADITDVRPKHQGFLSRTLYVEGHDSRVSSPTSGTPLLPILMS